MSQWGGLLPDFARCGSSPQKPCPSWPPSDWVRQELAGTEVVRHLHRSGTEVLQLAQGGVVVSCGESPEARRVANAVESYLWNAGYRLVAGGGPNHPVSFYGGPFRSGSE